MDEGAYPDGVFDFNELVSSQYHFVDETLLIRDIANIRNKTMIYTRPRRFGKSINLSIWIIISTSDTRTTPISSREPKNILRS